MAKSKRSKIILLTPFFKDDLFYPIIKHYQKKIDNFIKFESINIKTIKIARNNCSRKISYESKEILNYIKNNDWVILCDQDGTKINSLDFSNKVDKWLQFSNYKRIIFVVGGAYGVNKEVKLRADYCLKLSDFTLNHFLANLLLYEQIYRSFCILKHLPYHN